MPPAELPPLNGDMTMSQVLQAYPGAQRALFAHYHIGGCRSCGFQPGETLAQVCERNENIPITEAVTHIQESHQGDASLQISPQDFDQLRRIKTDLIILDVRTREEHEAVKLPGARLLTQELVQEIFTSGDKTQTLVLYDHTGSRSLDAAAYFIGHGFAETKCLSGGIDAYSRDIDPSLPRYRIEIED
ncbi:rhodanese-like domain-containing protein [Prosthecobacter sp.]|uniref:rhodanese-like domain-containing protein n=1 Tax=Prosthecobacter sp. TaxID=1965333 RepID=UPI002ABA627F|nr:rhodanese-like domain-containing protein [Prosthecobacter sp.]MDZ4404768.1 rhodanese-like domain-containing protein [Prosthecobacter sp.]